MYSSPFRHSTCSPKGTFAFDLHVLATPPAFVLSQDQTLQLIYRPIPRREQASWPRTSVGTTTFRLPGGRLPAPASEARASGNRSNDLGWSGLLWGRPDHGFRPATKVAVRKPKLNILVWLCHEDIEGLPLASGADLNLSSRPESNVTFVRPGHILVTTYTLFTFQRSFSNPPLSSATSKILSTRRQRSTVNDRFPGIFFERP